ncbi:MAG: hypothetical protein KAT34_15745 [Candidatus Aminicenantes bacterium]|nr:hypothetical protein [Candidatus Aminicenantes bacterium]
MPKHFVILFLITALTGFAHPGETETLLKIPVRVAAAGGLEKNLVKKDFKLFINEEPRNIVAFFSKSRSLYRVKSKRNFVLCFNITEGGKNTEDAVSHFVQHILMDGDGLIIHSPVKKIVRLDSTGDRQKIAGDINKIVKKNGAIYKTDLERVVGNLEDLARMVALNPVSITYFINTYARLFNDFKMKFLIPGLSNYNQLASYLAGETEEKWLINFREEKVFPTFPNFQAAKEKIRSYTAGMKKSQADRAADINSGLDAIEKAMSFSESYPMEAILNFMLGLNINYNVIFYKRNTNTPGNNGITPGYIGVFKNLARKTGGIFIDTPNPAAALNAVKKNIDNYYEVVFKFNGKLEDKQIRVEVTKPGTKVFCRERFLKEEINAIVEMIGEAGIKITGYTLNGYNLKFKVSGLKIAKDETSGSSKTGLVRIDIKLINDKNEVIHQTGRALRSQEGSIDISVNLPAANRGYFKLTIEAVDLVSGRKTELNKYIKLK